MITKVELARDGSRTVYHRSEAGSKSWTHEPGEACEHCDKGRR